MTTNLLRPVMAALGIAAASVSLTSCYYDPAYGGGPSYGGGGYYSSGGYSSTSIFVSTGNPRWGYDPYCHSYYDYGRRAYYDPYRYGYYPVGYRPPIVYGVPHPYGWRRDYCPPPTRVTNITLTNYQNRGDAYRRMNYSWARQVQQREDGRRFTPPSRPVNYSPGGNNTRPDFRNDGRPDFRNNSRPDFRNGGRPDFRNDGSSNNGRPNFNRGSGFQNPDRQQNPGGNRWGGSNDGRFNPGNQPRETGRPQFNSPTRQFQPGNNPSQGQPPFRSREGGGERRFQPQQRQLEESRSQPQREGRGRNNNDGKKGDRDWGSRGPI